MATSTDRAERLTYWSWNSADYSEPVIVEARTWGRGAQQVDEPHQFYVNVENASIAAEKDDPVMEIALDVVTFARLRAEGAIVPLGVDRRNRPTKVVGGWICRWPEWDDSTLLIIETTRSGDDVTHRLVSIWFWEEANIGSRSLGHEPVEQWRTNWKSEAIEQAIRTRALTPVADFADLATYHPDPSP